MSDRIDKLESAVKKVAGDVGELRTDVKAQGKRVEQLSDDVEQLSEDVEHLSEDMAGSFEVLTASVKEIQRTQLALANAMTAAVKQLSVDKTLELRMQRLEDAVFGQKH